MGGKRIKQKERLYAIIEGTSSPTALNIEFELGDEKLEWDMFVVIDVPITKDEKCVMRGWFSFLPLTITPHEHTKKFRFEFDRENLNEAFFYDLIERAVYTVLPDKVKKRYDIIITRTLPYMFIEDLLLDNFSLDV